MATTDSRDLMGLVGQIPESDRPFRPYAYYGAEEDALTFYFKGDADYARRLNSRVTVFFSLDTNELVGCQIKSVRHVLEDIGSFDVSIRHGKYRLDMLFLALHGEFEDAPEKRKLYREIGRIASQTGLEIDVPHVVGC